jgi:TPR repeat protein
LHGEPEAQNHLGLMFLNGMGVQKDDAEAAQWFQRAADQGVAFAQYQLGISYAQGRGVDRDGEEALKWLTNAALQGLDLAKDYLRTNASTIR